MTAIRSVRPIAPGARYVELAMRTTAWREYAAANGLTGDWSRARRYSMSPQALHALYLKQCGCCYLCDDPLPSDLARAAIDHDHSCCPGAQAYIISCGRCVRGIACLPCNRLIGGAQDDPGRLRRIADNLEAANSRIGRLVRP